MFKIQGEKSQFQIYGPFLTWGDIGVEGDL